MDIMMVIILTQLVVEKLVLYLLTKTIYGNNTQLGKEANESIRSSHNMNDVRVGYFYQHT